MPVLQTVGHGNDEKGERGQYDPQRDQFDFQGQSGNHLEFLQFRYQLLYG
jgi:hypothetical protein